jgi:hypothetical protein
VWEKAGERPQRSLPYPDSIPNAIANPLNERFTPDPVFSHEFLLFWLDHLSFIHPVVWHEHPIKQNGYQILKLGLDNHLH